MMCSKQKDVLGFLVTVATCILLFCPGESFAYSTDIQHTHHGWTLEGEFVRFGYLEKPLIISDDRLVFVQKSPNRRSKKSWPRDIYTISAVKIDTGAKIYSATVKYNNCSFQIKDILPLHKRVIVYGYYQIRSGIENREICALILDEFGATAGNLVFDRKPSLIAADAKTDLLLYTVATEASSQDFLSNQTELRFLKIRSGAERVSRSLSPFVYTMVGDGKGHIYFGRRGEKWPQLLTGKLRFLNGYVDKYSILPWKEEWSVNVQTQFGFPDALRVNREVIRYGIYNRNGSGITPKDRTFWPAEAIDAETGKDVSVSSPYDPNEFRGLLNGKQYIIKTSTSPSKISVIFN